MAWLVMETLTVLLQGSNTTNTNAGKHTRTLLGTCTLRGGLFQLKASFKVFKASPSSVFPSTERLKAVGSSVCQANEKNAGPKATGLNKQIELLGFQHPEKPTNLYYFITSLYNIHMRIDISLRGS